MDPLVTVIVPCYNVETCVEKCIRSIEEQTYKNIEIICVDDGSTDKTSMILKKISKNKKIKIITHEKNKGLYHARLSGVENAKGKYIAFVDSDDHVSIDFFRCLVNEAERTNADMTMCKVVHESLGEKYVHGSYYNYVFPTMRGKDILNKYLEQEGLCFIWHTVWNKLYSKKIWDEALPYLREQEKHLIMAEDLVYSSILYYFANRFSSVDYAYYFYVKNNNASTNISVASEKKLEKNIMDLSLAFNFVENFYKKINLQDKQLGHFYKWRELYTRFWADNIKNSSASESGKERLYELLKKLFKLNSITYSSDCDNYFYKHCIPWDSRYEDFCRRLVLGSEIYVSFDIFDTLVTRPFYEPSDLFRVINYHSKGTDYELFNFYKLRCESEKICRSKKDYPKNEVTLDEIYLELEHTFHVGADVAEYYKQVEIKEESRFLRVRKSIQNVYNMLKYLGRNIIAISDFYISGQKLKKMLSDLGYEFKKIYVSCDYNKTKVTGSLFKFVLDDLKIKPNEIIHVGDNWESDKLSPDKLKMASWFYAKAIDAFMCRIGDIPSSHIVDVVSKPLGTEESNMRALEFLGFRSTLAIVGNYLYDNPYIAFKKDEEFGSNLEYIGYCALGSYMLGISMWLKNEIPKNTRIHFISRDGYLPKKSFDCLFGDDKSIETTYTYMSRKALMPLKIESPVDFYSMLSDINLKNITYATIVSMLEPILDINKIKWKYDLNCVVETEENFIEFVDILANLLDYRKKEIYKLKLKDYFSKIINEGDVVFDIGYSGRAQILISKLLGYPVNAFYIHTINDGSQEELSHLNIKIKSYYAHTPAIVGGIREYIVSELAPSCTSYELDGGQIKPKFEQRNIPYCTWFLISSLQDASLRFINDFKNTFSSELPIMYVRQHEMSIPFELLINRITETDRYLFLPCDFEDDLYYGKNVSLVGSWGDALKYYKIEKITDILWRFDNKQFNLSKKFPYNNSS